MPVNVTITTTIQSPLDEDDVAILSAVSMVGVVIAQRQEQQQQQEEEQPETIPNIHSSEKVN